MTMSATEIEALLSAVGRQRRPGKDFAGRRYLGRGPRADVMDDVPQTGDIVDRTDGPYLVISVEQPYLITDDDIEDRDAWARYRHGGGWYVRYTAVPVKACQ
jgi:hypothetical protein